MVASTLSFLLSSSDNTRSSTKLSISMILSLADLTISDTYVQASQTQPVPKTCSGNCLGVRSSIVTKIRFTFSSVSVWCCSMFSIRCIIRMLLFTRSGIAVNARMIRLLTSIAVFDLSTLLSIAIPLRVNAYGCF